MDIFEQYRKNVLSVVRLTTLDSKTLKDALKQIATLIKVDCSAFQLKH